MKHFYLKILFTIILFFFTFLHISHAALPLIGILINDGNKFTNTREVTVKIKSLKNAGSLMESMQIGIREDLSDTDWQVYSENPISITLPAGDGEKYIFVRLKDKAGNISPIESGRIILDSTPPLNMDFFINKGEEYTNDRTGRVFLQYKGEDAQYWQISNNQNFTDKWDQLGQNKEWLIDLRGGDGEKTVFARFKDEAGNISDIQTKTIILDTEPPKNGEIIINSGEKYIKNPNVKLKVKADGANLVRIIDRNGGENYDFEPGSDGYMIINWKFDTLQGKKIVKAYFMDAARNKTNASVDAETIYDTEGPATPRLVINKGNKYTNEPNGKVDLQIFLRVNEDNLTMELSNEEKFQQSKTLKYAPTITGWILKAGEDGLKNIYLRLTDEAGNKSDVVSSSIVLDRKPPKIVSFVLNEGNTYVTTPKVNIQINVEDAAQMQISNNPNFPPATPWEPYNPVKIDWRIIPGDGEKIVYARFKDEAGNISDIVSSKVVLDAKPPLGKATINDGNKYVSEPNGNVVLKFDFEGSDVMGMQISNTSDFTNVKLLPVQNQMNWQLEGPDGVKTVYFRFKDKAGNFSQIFTSRIMLDRMPPENCDIFINNGAEWMTNNSKKVALTLTATDAYKMKISNTPDFSNVQWMPYKTAIGWTLEGEEGEHTVYALFADESGNEAPVVSATIKTDFTPPLVKSFTINGGSKYVNDPQKKVVLNIDVEGAETMAIGNSPITESTTWEPIVQTKEWILSNEDGLKTVYSRFKDPAGNVSSEVSEKIMLDRVPPTECEIAINKNAEWMTDKEGKITVFLKANGASEMMVSNNPEFTNATWETYTAIKDNWQIDIKNTQAAVYAKFKDPAGNISDVVNASIKIDITPPQNPKIVINKGSKYLTGNDRKANIAISVEGAKFMRISTDKSFRGAEWEPLAGFKEFVVLEGDGEKEFFAQFKDQADNLSEVVSAKITLDTTPPVIRSFVINNGEDWTNDKEKKVTLNVNAEDAFEMRVDNDPAFSHSSWQKFSKKIDGFVLAGDDGEKTVFLLLKDEAGNVTPPISAKINLKRTF